MLKWAELQFPPINLWSAPNWLKPKTEDKEMQDIPEKHKKFAAYWEKIGKPKVEYRTDASYPWQLSAYDEPLWSPGDYRIANDPHHELRLKWINSDFTLPIEVKPCVDAPWKSILHPSWYSGYQYREAQPASTEFDPLQALRDQIAVLTEKLEAQQMELVELHEKADALKRPAEPQPIKRQLEKSTLVWHENTGVEPEGKLVLVEQQLSTELGIGDVYEFNWSLDACYAIKRFAIIE